MEQIIKAVKIIKALGCTLFLLELCWPYYYNFFVPLSVLRGLKKNFLLNRGIIFDC